MLFPFQLKSIHNKLAFSLYSAAALIHLLRRQRDAVGLSLLSDKITLHTPAKLSESHAQMLYSELNKCLSESYQQTSFNKETNLTETLDQLAEAIHKRSLIIVFSDFLQQDDNEKLFKALQHLKYNQNEVILFHVADEIHEKNFEFENRPTELTDMETGEVVKINPNAVREAYKNKVTAIINQLHTTCDKYKIDFVTADINKGFEQILTNYLVKRNKLY
jgi:uncharacterized protein (DUF58 family)